MRFDNYHYHHFINSENIAYCEFYFVYFNFDLAFVTTKLHIKVFSPATYRRS